MCMGEYTWVSFKEEQSAPKFVQFFYNSDFVLFQINGGEKRPASDMGKKPKTPKKKKKKDPNEPQKPVSAYALFFRDTQAAIKGQNPNATFGEVSKIVASMWDGLGEEQKQVRKDTKWMIQHDLRKCVHPKEMASEVVGCVLVCVCVCVCVVAPVMSDSL